MAKKSPSTIVEVILPSQPHKPSPPPAVVGRDAPVVEVLPPVTNSLAGAIGYNAFDINGFPGNQGTGWSEQISSTNSAFKNLRWYLVSNFRQLLSQLYVEIGLVQTICDVPVDDALRGGIKVKTKQLDETQIEKLQVNLDRDNDIAKAGQAAKWNRLYGGAGILILTDQDPEEPFDPESLEEGDRLEYRAVDMWELFWDKQNLEGSSPSLDADTTEYYSYYGVKVHSSRVMRLKGIEAPSFIRPRLRGWGFSVVEGLIRSLNQYFKGTDLIYEVMDEYKVDVFKIKNLVNTLMSPGGEDKVRRRIQLAAWQKNYQNALTMDAEDDWEHKQLSFSGIGETLEQVRMQVASDMRMPLTKLFGISAAGFNSGEDDLEVYNAMVESQVRDKIKYQIMRMVEIKCQVLFGFIPDDLSIEFLPLRMLSAEQEENTKTQKFNRLIQSLQAGAVDGQFFREAANKSNLFDLQMENVQSDFNPGGTDQPEDAAEDGEEGDPDADNPDTQKAKVTPLRKKTTPKDKPDPKPARLANSHGLTIVAPSLNAVSRVRRRYTPVDRLARVIFNSALFDRAAYDADGGDDWVDPRRRELFRDPRNVDKKLWDKAKKASVAALGEERWQFTVWFYRKMGGRFS